MNSWLSLQGRMSLDRWNGVGNGPDRNIDKHMEEARATKFGLQTTESDGDLGTLPPTTHPRQQHHRKQSSLSDLHQLREPEELGNGDEDEIGADADRRALLPLLRGKPKQQHHHWQQQSRQP